VVGLGGVGGDALCVPPVKDSCSTQVGGVTVQTLLFSDENEESDENAKQLAAWMEQGAFKAMHDGYLVRPARQRPCARAYTTHARTGRLTRGRTSACSSSLPMRMRR
jgi:hypothetical protein